MAEHDFIQHLKEDHREQKDLGERLAQASDPGEREQLRHDLYDALYPHMVGEEASIFPYLENSGDQEAGDDAKEAVQEHHVGKLVLREIMDLSTDSEVFQAKAKVLDELNRHHIDEEEEDVFGHLKRLASDQKLGELFEKYEEAEEQAEKE